MIDREKVKACLKEIGRYTDEELTRFANTVEAAAQSVEADMKSPSDTAAAEMLAAAQANLMLALSGEGAPVTSFAAGDVKITQEDNRVNNAKSLVRMVKAACRRTMNDSAFDFRSV